MKIKKQVIIFVLFVCCILSFCFQCFAEENKAIKDPMVIDVLDLKNVDVMDVLKLISQKSGINIVAGQNVKGRVTVYLRDVEVNDALSIIVDSYGWAYVEENGIIKVMTGKEYETKYGKKFGQETKTAIKQLLYANVPDALGVLNQIKSATGKIVADEKSNTIILVDEMSKVNEMEDIIKRIDVPTQTEVFELSYAEAEGISSKISETLTPGLGKIRYDERSNKIIITDTEKKMNEVKAIIKAFDAQHKEVLIEAKIIQVVLSDEYKMGVDWEAIVSNYHSLDILTNFDILSSNEKGGKVSIGTIDNDNYTAMVEALETVGSTDILSSPRITTLNNKEAKILVGSTEPYVTTTTTTPSSGPTTTAESVNFVEVGVKLFVTPTIHNDGFITMKIKPEISSKTGTIETGNNNVIPVVETSEAETTVMVKDGVTIVIGGLIKEEKLKTTKKVPFIGSVPFFGTFFRSENDAVQKTEIVIFLTPNIITGDVPFGG